MVRYVVNRLGQMVVILFLISLATFLLLELVPGDAATALLGDGASTEDYQLLREKLGLDQPVYVRYARWAGSMLRGDFGTSLVSRYPVAHLYLQRLPSTIQLTLCGLLFAVVTAVPAGIFAALRHNSRADILIRGVATFGTAMPNFWLGLLLIYAFSLKLKWFTSSGIVPLSTSFLGWAGSMVLPALTIGLRFSSIVVRQTRSAFMKALSSDYVRTARAKGVAEFLVVARHVMKNALIPVITVVGLQLGRLFGGAVITEAIFQIPGIGNLMADAVFSRDLAVVLAGVMIAAIAVLTINLLVDIVYSIIDPRIRLTARKGSRP
jgi:peptide/nickel transport system permease protein